MRKGVFQQLEARKSELEKKLTELQERRELLDKMKVLLLEASAYAREQARQQVEGMVTNALQMVFGPDMEFHIKMEESHGRVEAEYLVSSSYEGSERIENRPQDARGGGVVDVVCLALRLALLEASRPAIQGPVILDEPAKHVSDEYSPSVVEFLKGVSRSFDRQVIMVTHNTQLAEAGDASFLVELKDGKSHVRQKRDGGVI
ncbi:MAG TPA: hypothetical protein GXX40_08815 [Firmicutes bacterium]|nr:hypothetical protein [Bacillota bacterium]